MTCYVGFYGAVLTSFKQEKTPKQNKQKANKKNILDISQDLKLDNHQVQLMIDVLWQVLLAESKQLALLDSAH